MKVVVAIDSLKGSLTSCCKPLGGMVRILVTGNAKNTVSFMEFGLSKVVGVPVLLVGTGAIAGIIKASALQYAERDIPK